MSTIRVEIVSAEEEIWSGEGTMVYAPGTAGELGIAPRHTPLITQLKPGDVLRVEVYGVPDDTLNQVETLILPDGKSDLYFMENSKLEGMTVDELRAELRTRMAEEIEPTDIRVQVTPAEEASGEAMTQPPPVVLIPGIGAGARLFGTLPRRFARHGFPCITFDPVGVAPSSPHPGAASPYDLFAAG